LCIDEKSGEVYVVLKPKQHWSKLDNGKLVENFILSMCGVAKVVLVEKRAKL
jgi:hypothetical protein